MLIGKCVYMYADVYVTSLHCLHFVYMNMQQSCNSFISGYKIRKILSHKKRAWQWLKSLMVSVRYLYWVSGSWFSVPRAHFWRHVLSKHPNRTRLKQILIEIDKWIKRLHQFFFELPYPIKGSFFKRPFRSMSIIVYRYSSTLPFISEFCHMWAFLQNK